MSRLRKGRKWGTMVLATALLGSSFMLALPNSLEAAPSESYAWKSVVTGGGGGFIPGIIFNESEQDLIYARTDIGGAYRWNPSDESWIPLTDWVGFEDWNKNGVDALATDPVDPDRVYMAVGTYTNDWDPDNGYILRSTDRGNTWAETQLPFKVGGNMPGRSMGERLAVDPNKNNILYFGARSGNGLWKSTDYGATWTQVNAFPNPGTYIEVPGDSYQGDIVGLSWITFDKSSSAPGTATQTIYVGVADKSNSVFRSTDGGVTWTAIPGQPTGYIPHHGVLSANGDLYISYIDGAGPYRGEKGAVWKLDTATGVWTDVSPLKSNDPDLHFGFGGLTVDAQNPDTVMVASLNAWWPDEQIYRSTNGGETWSPIWEWDGYPGRKLKYKQDISAAPWLDFGSHPAPPETTPKLGWMIGDLEIDPFDSDRMMYGTGATLYGSDNVTKWDEPNGKIDISVMAKGIEETYVRDLISPPTGAPLISALADISGFRHTQLDAVPTRMHLNPSNSFSLDYAELDPGFVVRAGGVDANYPTAKIFGLSRDGGANWYTANHPQTKEGGGTVALAADGEAIVWSLAEGVYYTTNSGNSWTLSTGIPAGAKVASDRVNPDKFYGFSAGTFYVSNNGGATFTATAATGLPGSGDLDFKAMPGREGDIWLAGGSKDGLYGLWHSTDSGASFTKLSNVQEANVVGFGKAAPDQNYMAIYTSAKVDDVRGVFRSDDAGASWVRINDDEHQYASINVAITGDPRIYGRVYLGTNGRGILYADPTNTPQLPGPGQSASITPQSATFDLNPEVAGDVKVTITPNGNTLTDVRSGATTLVEGRDYTVVGSTVTILKDYLSELTKGNHALVFHFSSGNPATLTLNVLDSTPTIPLPEGALKVAAYNGTTAPASNTLNPRIRLTNTGSEAMALSDVTLRYYYTANGEQGQQIFFDWSTVGAEHLKGSFKKVTQPSVTADTYAEIGFGAGAGILPAGQSLDIQVRIVKNDWSNYNQADDYSFNSSATAYMERPEIPVYAAGQLLWGREPK
ncbi:X2-like carbohydrate binding domain-containing protein [Paenibacillus massiliensis]|uniref:X2-like carbohydrate binding domain-containing protein n=1 Tax=Paenibacillus massiliensis TaxID=225917 RepID=UPI0004703921|nr:X2-like carbohydrate binding domain-containing protein [Paenibacillus massiliensis]